MKKLLLLLSLIPVVGNAQGLKFDSGIAYDGKGFKIAATTPLAPLTKDGKVWFEAVAAMKPAANEQLWVGMGLSYNYKFDTGPIVSVGFGLTSNILRESFDKSMSLFYVKAGLHW